MSRSGIPPNLSSFLLRVLLLAAFGSIFISCGDNPDPEIEFLKQDCSVFPQQRDTFDKYRRVYPLAVTIHNGVGGRGLNTDEFRKVTVAIQAWNSVRAREGKGPFFQNPTVQAIPSQLLDNPRSFIEGGENHGVFILKVGDNIDFPKWNLYKKDLGYTSSYSKGHQVVYQTITMNAPPDQFLSIIYHELGHAIGMDHSCNPDKGSPTFPFCGTVPLNTRLIEAVMFPTLRGERSLIEVDSFGTVLRTLTIPSEKKEGLRINDEERAACFL